MTNSNNTSTTTSTYKTINGIQKLPAGNYRVRKTIKGVKYSLNFNKRKDAMNYLALINNPTTTSC